MQFFLNKDTWRMFDDNELRVIFVSLRAMVSAMGPHKAKLPEHLCADLDTAEALSVKIHRQLEPVRTQHAEPVAPQPVELFVPDEPKVWTPA